MSNTTSQSDTLTAFRRGGLLTPNEAAEYLRLPVRQLQQMRYRGVGPAYSHVGRTVRYAIHDLDNYVASQRIEPQGAA
jgi:excisionase family DNA binding protein